MSTPMITDEFLQKLKVVLNNVELKTADQSQKQEKDCVDSKNTIEFKGNYEKNIQNLIHDMKVANKDSATSLKYLGIFLEHKTPNVILTLCARYRLYTLAKELLIIPMKSIDAELRRIIVSAENFKIPSNYDTSYWWCLFWYGYLYGSKINPEMCDNPKSFHAIICGICASDTFFGETLIDYYFHIFDKDCSIYPDALYHAFQMGHQDTINYLLSIKDAQIQKAIYHRPNDAKKLFRYNKYLMIALGSSGKLDFIKKYLESNDIYQNYSLVFLGAIEQGHNHVINWVITKYPDIVKRDKDKIEDFASRGGNYEYIVKYCNPPYGLLSYENAANNGHIDIAKKLGEF